MRIDGFTGTILVTLVLITAGVVYTTSISYGDEYLGSTKRGVAAYTVRCHESEKHSTIFTMGEQSVAFGGNTEYINVGGRNGWTAVWETLNLFFSEQELPMGIYKLLSYEDHTEVYQKYRIDRHPYEVWRRIDHLPEEARAVKEKADASMNEEGGNRAFPCFTSAPIKD